MYILILLIKNNNKNNNNHKTIKVTSKIYYVKVTKIANLFLKVFIIFFLIFFGKFLFFLPFLIVLLRFSGFQSNHTKYFGLYI